MSQPLESGNESQDLKLLMKYNLSPYFTPNLGEIDAELVKT